MRVVNPLASLGSEAEALHAPGVDVFSDAQINELFEELDTTASGSLDPADIKTLLVKMGQNAGKKDVKSLLLDMATAGGNRAAKSVARPAFVQWYQGVELDHPVRNYLRITHGLSSAVRQDSDCLSDHEIIEVFVEVDIDGTGTFSIANARFLLKKIAEAALHGRPPPTMDGAVLVAEMASQIGAASEKILTQAEFVDWYHGAALDHFVRDYIRVTHGLTSAVREKENQLSEREVLKTASELDISKSGALNASDLSGLLSKMGMPARKDDIEALLREMARVGGLSTRIKEIPYSVFVRWYENSPLEHPIRDYIRKAKGLASAVREDADVMSDMEVLQVFRELDVSKSGTLNMGDVAALLENMGKKADETAAIHLLAEMGSSCGDTGVLPEGSEIPAKVFLAWYKGTALDHPVRDFIRITHGLSSAVRKSEDMLSRREIIEIFNDFDVELTGNLVLTDIQAILAKMAQPADQGSAAVLMAKISIAGGEPAAAAVVSMQSWVVWYENLSLDNPFRDYIRQLKGLSTSDSRAKTKLQERLTQKQLKTMKKCFKRIDVDGSGSLEPAELKLLMMELGKEAKDDYIERIMLEVDTDGDGYVTLQEFESWWLETQTLNMQSLVPMAEVKKSLAFTPMLIFYHLFDANSDWFLTMGRKGKPLRMLGDLITWSLNFFQLVWTMAAILETELQFSSNPHRNPKDHEFYDSLWYGTNLFCTVLFLTELMMISIGAASTGNFREVYCNPMVYVDIATIASGIQRIGGQIYVDLRCLRILRLTRVLKTLRSERINSLAPVVWEIAQKSALALMAPLYLMTLMLVIMSSLCFMAESANTWTCTLADGTVIARWEPTMEYNPGCITDTGCECAGTLSIVTVDGTTHETDVFISVPRTMWWCLVTMTTVGYGDMVPRTRVGQLVGALTGVLGLLTIAMPISIVGGSFHHSYQKLEAHLLEKKQILAERQALVRVVSYLVGRDEGFAWRGATD
jgi:hypothetical protein